MANFAGPRQLEAGSRKRLSDKEVSWPTSELIVWWFKSDLKFVWLRSDLRVRWPERGLRQDWPETVSERDRRWPPMWRRSSSSTCSARTTPRVNNSYLEGDLLTWRRRWDGVRGTWYGWGFGFYKICIFKTDFINVFWFTYQIKIYKAKSELLHN